MNTLNQLIVANDSVTGRFNACYILLALVRIILKTDYENTKD